MASAQRREVVRGLLEIPVVGALAILIVVVIRAALVQPFYIPSPSMVPQLQVNDKILVSRLSYRLHPIHRGDVIVFDEPPGAQTGPPHHHPGGLSGLWRSAGETLGLVPRTDELVKRVIGLPGDRVEGHDNHVYVNGRLLLEPYLPTGEVIKDFAAMRIPKGMLWVMGDNRGDSLDSRSFGPIRRATVVGRAVVRVWPLTDLSFL